MPASSRQLERVVEQLEFTAALATTPMFLRQEQIEVAELVETDLDGLRNLEGPTVTSGPHRGPAVVVGDRRWLQRSIHELIDNARKFSAPGGRVKVTTAGVAKAGRAGVEVIVVDTGRGMSAAETSRAFDQFVQGDSSETRSYGGLGLGLTMVRRVVDAHSGSIGASSTPGGGTTMSMWLPAEDRETSQPGRT